MRSRFLSALFTILGLIAAIGFPIAAATTQVRFLCSQADVSFADKVGLTASGIAVGVFIIGFTVWKYISVLLRERLKTHRTLFGFWATGYLVFLVVENLIDSLQIIFLGGAIGTTFAIVFFYLSDRCKERRRGQ